MPGNLKVTLDFEDTEGAVRLWAAEDGCDPRFKVLRTTELADVVDAIGPFVEESRTSWAEEPRYAAYQKPRQSRSKKAAATPAEAPAETPAAAPAGATTTAELPLLAGGEAQPPQEELPLLAGPAATEEEGEVTSMVSTPERPEDEEQSAVATQPEPDDEDEDDDNGGDNGDGPEDGDSDGGDQEPVAQTEATAKASRGAKYVYKVVIDGQEQQFDHTHDALRALGVSQADIDAHKYWHRHDRLPKEHKERIEQVPVTA